MKKPLLDAVVAVLNSHPEHALALSHLNIDEHVIAFAAQEGLDAIVVHLVGVHRADVVIVGEPSRSARRKIALFCEHIGRAWNDLGVLALGPRDACTKLAIPERIACPR